MTSKRVNLSNEFNLKLAMLVLSLLEARGVFKIFINFKFDPELYTIKYIQLISLVTGRR